jgi:hypothetical protein
MRTARDIPPGSIVHVISRFADHRWFLGHEDERATYRRMFTHAMRQSDWRTFASCLMSTHIHHGMIAGEQDLEEWAKSVHSPFAQWMNMRHDRIGQVFSDRPQSIVVEPSNAPALIAYIHNNPVVAGLVDRARDSTWSTHRAVLGLDPAPPWLDVPLTLELAGCPADPNAFDDYVHARVGDKTCDPPEMKRLRRLIREYGPYEVATPCLVADGKHVIPIVARPFGVVRPELDRIIREVARAAGVTTDDIRSRYARKITTARAIVMLVAGAYGIPLSDMAALLGITRQRASQLAHLELDDDSRATVRRVVELLQRPRARRG